MADLPGGASGMLAAGTRGSKPIGWLTRIDPGVVSLLAELRAHERQAAEERGQWKTVVEERKPLDVSPAAITLVAISDRRPRSGQAVVPTLHEAKSAAAIPASRRSKSAGTGYAPAST